MSKTDAVEKPAVNYVHLQTIHRESIRKEQKYENVNRKLDFTLSPFNCKMTY